MLYIITHRNSTKKNPTKRQVITGVRYSHIGNTTVQVFGRMFCWPDSSSQYYFFTVVYYGMIWHIMYLYVYTVERYVITSAVEHNIFDTAV